MDRSVLSNSLGVFLVAIVLAGCSDEASAPADTGPDAGGGEGELGGPCRSAPVPCDEGLACDFRVGLCAPDCSDASRACFTPFACVENEATERSACEHPDAAPSCRGTPAGQALSFTTNADDIPLRWDLAGGCIAVSYETALGDLADRVRVAHQGWQDLACSNLCFEDPVESDEFPDLYRAEQRIQWAVGPTASNQVLPSVFFEIDTGVIVGAEILLPEDDERRAALTDQAFLFSVGIVTGIAATSDSTVDTVVFASQPPLGGDRTVPGADDEVALCAMYGDPSYCGE